MIFAARALACATVVEANWICWRSESGEFKA
jgi:hypothetical protein